MPLSYSLYLALASFGLGSVFSVLFGRWKNVARMASLFWGVLGSGLLIYLSWQLFSLGTSFDFQLFEGIRTITTAIHIDIFTAFFLLLVGLVGLGFFSFWSTEGADEHWLTHALAHGVFLMITLVVASSNVLFFIFVSQCFGLGGFFYILLSKRIAPAIQRKAAGTYLVLLEIASVLLTVMWLLLASSAQNLYFGALVQGVGTLPDPVTWLVSGTLITSLVMLAIAGKQVAKVIGPYYAGMYSALLLIFIVYLLLRIELFFVPAVSLWLDVGIAALGLALLAFFSIYAFLKRTVLTIWSMAVSLVLVLIGLFLWSIQGNIAAIVSIWAVAVFWGILTLVVNVALYFWARPYKIINQARVVIWGAGLFTTLWLFFQGLWQSVVLVSDHTWHTTMLVILVASILVGLLYTVSSCYRSATLEQLNLGWKQVTHWGLLIWTATALVAMFASGAIINWLGSYTASFLGLSGTLVEGTWSSYSVSMLGLANTIHLPFALMLVVLFWLVISLLVSSKQKHPADTTI